MFTALDTGMGVKYYVDLFRKNSERGTESPLRNALVLMEDRRVEGHYIFMGWETTEMISFVPVVIKSGQLSSAEHRLIVSLVLCA